jgi:hypothetical protein
MANQQISLAEHLPFLEKAYGIKLPSDMQYTHEMRGVFGDESVSSITAATSINNGIPSIFNTVIDPDVIRTIITPLRTEEIYGAEQRGTFVTKTLQFARLDPSGYAATYGDNSPLGVSNLNVNFTQRQSIPFQTWITYGDMESAMYGEAGLSWVSEKQQAAGIILAKQANAINCFGVDNLQLYGALNDPNLPASITPTNKSTTTTESLTWTSTTDPNLIYNDLVKAYNELVTQMGGNIDLDTPIHIVIPSSRQSVLAYANDYNTTLRSIVEKSYPSWKFFFLPEAGSTLSGGLNTTNMMQMFVPKYLGQNTVTTAFTSKLQMGRIENFSTERKQKFMQGTWGTIWRYPVACVTMVGI